MKRVLFQINVTANWGSTGKIAEQIGQCAMSLGIIHRLRENDESIQKSID